MEDIKNSLIYILLNTKLELWFFLFLIFAIVFSAIIFAVNKFLISSTKFKLFLVNFFLGVVIGFFYLLLQRIFSSNIQNINNEKDRLLFDSFYYLWWNSICILIIINFGKKESLLGFMLFSLLYFLIINKNIYISYPDLIISDTAKNSALVVFIIMLLIFLYLTDIFKNNLFWFIKAGSSIRLLIIYFLLFIIINIIVVSIFSQSLILISLYWMLFIFIFIVIMILILLIIKKYFIYQADFRISQMNVAPNVIYNDFIITQMLKFNKSETGNQYGFYCILKNTDTGQYVRYYDESFRQLIKNLQNFSNIIFFINKNNYAGVFIIKHNLNDVIDENNRGHITFKEQNSEEWTSFLNNLSSNKFNCRISIFGIHSEDVDILDQIASDEHLYSFENFKRKIAFFSNFSNDYYSRYINEINNEYNFSTKNNNQLMSDLYPIMKNKTVIGYINKENFSKKNLNEEISFGLRKSNFSELKYFEKNQIFDKIIFIKINLNEFNENFLSNFFFEKIIYFLDFNIQICITFDINDYKGENYDKILLLKNIYLIKDNIKNYKNIYLGIVNANFNKFELEIFNSSVIDYIILNQAINEAIINNDSNLKTTIQKYCKKIKATIIYIHNIQGSYPANSMRNELFVNYNSDRR